MVFLNLKNRGMMSYDYKVELFSRDVYSNSFAKKYEGLSGYSF